MKPHSRKVGLDIKLTCDYLVGGYSEIFPRQPGVLKQMADMLKAISFADPDKVADDALIRVPIGPN